MKFNISEEDKNKSGIYMITNIISGKFYIGSACNFRNRYNLHIRDFNRNKNSPHLQRAYNKYGEENFEMEIIDFVENKKNLLIIESMYIVNLYSTYSCTGYNICKFANSRLGTKASEESKQKMSNSQKGRTLSEETKEKLREINLGKKYTDEAKVNMSNAQKGIKCNEETKEKLREINLGKKHTQETKDKIGIKSKTWIRSDQTKINMSNAQKGHIVSEETRDVLRKQFQGEKSCNAKLTEKEVIEIKKLLSEGNLFQREIAVLFNVSRGYIATLKANKRWKHVKLDDE